MEVRIAAKGDVDLAEAGGEKIDERGDEEDANAGLHIFCEIFAADDCQRDEDMGDESKNLDVVGRLRTARNGRDQNDRGQDSNRHQGSAADGYVFIIEAAQQKLYRQRGAVPVIDMRKNVEDISKGNKRIDRAENVNDGGRRRIKIVLAGFF